MNALPDGRAGKVAALGVAGLLAAVLHFGFLSPVLAFYASNAQELEQRRELVRRYQSAANDLPRLREAASRRRDPSADGALLLTGTSDAIAAAELQSRLKELVEQEGAKINSAATLPPADEGNLRRVGVRVAFSGDLTLLTALLENVEAARPVLAVGNFEIRTAGEADDGEDPDLAVALEVFGYRAK